ncbi:MULTISPECIES: toxin-antitoxin system YwqK family antitoxin [Chryseobacterium]|nr:MULTISPECIES: hypothetical protein [Chryseobacterium]
MINFVNGLKHDSLAFTYYLGAASKGKYVKGLKEGIWTSTNREGKLYDISNYNNGKKNGRSIKFNYNGTLQDTLTYKNDKLEGWQIRGVENGKRKELFENDVLKESIQQQNNGNFSFKLKYIRLNFQDYSWGNRIWSKNGKKFSDSITLYYDDKKIERTVYTKLNDSLYHKIQTVKDRTRDEVTINFYNKRNKLYMKYLLSYVSSSANEILFEDFFFSTQYDEETKSIEVGLCNPCQIWEGIGRKNFTVYTYDDENKEHYYNVRWIKSDGDMLADFCYPNVRCEE